jgi:chromosome segregation ATPase
MTTQHQLDRLTQIAGSCLESIQALERVTSQHQNLVEKHDSQIENILNALERHNTDQARTDAAIRAMADEVINTQREWRGYLRRIPRQ